VRVVIAVPTFRRTEQLRELLPELLDQANSIDPPAQVVVADNDPDGSARAVVRDCPESVRYVHEPRPGLAAVRNRLLDESRDFDALAFIDDDEKPAAGWLAELVSAWRLYGCAAVSGPVRSVFDNQPEAWIATTAVFRRPQHASGTLRTGGASNNLLLDLRWLRQAELRFDPAYGESGGEDTKLMHSIVAAGGEIRWCDTAEVTELVPPERQTKQWVRQRLIRTSNSWARVEMDIAALQGQRARRMLWVGSRGGYLLIRSLAQTLFGLLRRDEKLQTLGACNRYRSLGVARAILGSVSAEYRRPPAATNES